MEGLNSQELLINDQCFYYTKSLFQWLGLDISPELSELLNGLPFFKSTLSLMILIGKQRNQDFGAIDAVISYSLQNTLSIICKIFNANPVETLSNEERSFISTIISGIGNMFVSFFPFISDNPQQASIVKSFLDRFSYDCLNFTYKSDFNDTFSMPVIELCSNISQKILSHFDFACTTEPLLVLFQSLVYFQSLGVFMFNEGIKSSIITYDSLFFEASNLYINGDEIKSNEILIKVHDSLISEYELFNDHKYHIIIQNSIAFLCSSIQSFSSLLKISENTFSQTIIEDSLPIEFSGTINEVLSGLYANTVDHDIVKQLSESLYSRTKDSQLQYICSAAAFLPQYSIGYVALMGSYLLFDQAQMTEHYSQFFIEMPNHYMASFMKFSSIDPNLINLHNYLDIGILNNFSSIINSYLEAGAKVFDLMSCSIPQIDLFQNEFLNLSYVFISFVKTMMITAQSIIVPLFIAVAEHNSSFVEGFKDDFINLQSVTLCDITFHESKQVFETMKRCIIQLRAISKSVDISQTLLLVEQVYTNLNQVFFGGSEVKHSDIAKVCQYFISIVESKLSTIPAAFEEDPSLIVSLHSEIIILSFIFEFIILVLDQTANTNYLANFIPLLDHFCNSIDDIQSKSNSLLELLLTMKDSLIHINLTSTEAVMTNERYSEVESINVSNDFISLSDMINAANNYLLLMISENPIFKNSISISHPIINELLEVRNKVNISAPDVSLDLKDILTNRVDFVAGLPLISNTHFRLVEKYSIPFLIEIESDKVQKAYERILFTIRISIPFCRKCEEIIDGLIVKNDMLEEISSVSSMFNYDFHGCDETDLRNKSVFDATALTAAAIVFSYGIFCETTVEEASDSIIHSTNTQFIIQTAQTLLSHFIAMSMFSQCYSSDNLKHLFNVYNSLELYRDQNSSTNQRVLYGSVLKLPTIFEPIGSNNYQWSACASIIFREDPQQILKLENLTLLLGIGGLTLDQIINSQVRTAALPSKVTDIKYKQVGGVQVSSNLMSVRQIEAARSIQISISKLKRAYKEGSQIVEAHQQFSACIQRLNESLSALKDQSSSVLVQTVLDTYNKIEDMIKNGGKSFDPYIDTFEHVTHDLISLWMKTFGLTNLAQAELILMTSKVDALQSAVDDNIEESMVGDNELRKIIAQEARGLLRMTRSLGKEAVAQFEHLIRTNQSLANERGLVKAAYQTSEAAQMFFMLLKFVDKNDPDFHFKTIAACRMMRAALTSLIVNMKLKSGNNTEITKRMEKTLEEIYSRLLIITDFAESIKQTDTLPMVQKSGMSLIVQQRNADSAVLKRRRELEEAEEQLKRFNRSNKKSVSK